MGGRLRILLLGLLCAALLSGIPAFAGPGGDRADKEERERRMKELEERLKGKTPQERDELRRRLQRLREKTELEKQELWRKHQKSRSIGEHLVKGLPSQLRRKLDTLPEKTRRAVVRWAVERMLAFMREEINESLTDEERARVEKLVGPKRHWAIFEIRKKKILAKLPRNQVAALKKLTPSERQKRIGALMWRETEAERERVNERVSKEIRRILKAPPSKIPQLLREA